MTLDERRKSSDKPIVWTDNLEDDCSARWAGLLLRAEWMHDGYWWWSVSDIENGIENIDDSTNYHEAFIGGVVARTKAEEVARKYVQTICLEK